MWVGWVRGCTNRLENLLTIVEILIRVCGEGAEGGLDFRGSGLYDWLTKKSNWEVTLPLIVQPREITYRAHAVAYYNYSFTFSCTVPIASKLCIYI